MKVLVGLFSTEVNEHIGIKTNISSYDFLTNEEMLDRMKLREVFQKENMEVIPSVYAKSSPNGVIEKETFHLIETMFLKKIKENLKELDGIYLHLHGASYVEKIGSGEFHLMREIRKIVGEYFPIAISCDPHGNLTKTYAESIQILRSFRESPHTDMIPTWQKTAKMLCDLLKHRQHIHAVYRKLPLILGGEQSVSADEPVASINKYMDKLEEDERIRSVSWHVGYLRHDCPEAGCGIVVVPMREQDQEYAEQVAGDVAKYVWDRRHEFHYTGITAEPNDAIQMACEFEGSPFVITDSGDNTTSGATGYNTTILRQFLSIRSLEKKVLFASIVDPKNVSILLQKEVGDKSVIRLGMESDEFSKVVELNVELVAKGKVARTVSFDCENDEVISIAGESVLVHVLNTKIDILITNHKMSYFKNVQFKFSKVDDWTKYDIVVVKQGYIFPELKKYAKGYVMALTDGATPQNTKKIPFKMIQRPIYPIDEL